MEEVIIRTEHATLWGQAGSRFIIDETPVDVSQPGLLIADCCLNDEADKGKGYGKALYRKALSQYGVLYSAWPVSDEALNVHDALIRSGEAHRGLTLPEYGLVSLFANQPVSQI